MINSIFSCSLNYTWPWRSTDITAPHRGQKDSFQQHVSKNIYFCHYDSLPWQATRDSKTVLRINQTNTPHCAPCTIFLTSDTHLQRWLTPSIATQIATRHTHTHIARCIVQWNPVPPVDLSSLCWLVELTKKHLLFKHIMIRCIHRPYLASCPQIILF